MYLTEYEKILIIAVKMIFSTNLNIHASLIYLLHNALKILAIQLESLEERIYSHREKFLIISIKIIPINQSIQIVLFYLLRKFDKNNKKSTKVVLNLHVDCWKNAFTGVLSFSLALWK